MRSAQVRVMPGTFISSSSEALLMSTRAEGEGAFDEVAGTLRVAGA
jgi:hypothetical protein